MQASLQRHNLEIGAGTSMFQLDYGKYSCLATPTWMQHTWKFFRDYDIAVDIKAPCPQVRRDNDQFLTTLFINLGYRKASLKALNRCRMFLQVSSLSDISSGDGCSILERFWRGFKDTLNLTHHKWPGCGNPSAHDWSLWRMALRKILYDDAASIACRRLRQPLGKWTDTSELWPWWYSSSENRLYRFITPT
eukprot:scaffold123677_cov34-Attheya_sp.AAC.5